MILGDRGAPSWTLLRPGFEDLQLVTSLWTALGQTWSSLQSIATAISLNRALASPYDIMRLVRPAIRQKMRICSEAMSNNGLSYRPSQFQKCRDYS